jgi:16S rRNA (guanine527-N7)-methyltransferase
VELNILLKYFTEFTNTQLRQLEALKVLYTEWNEKINVISRKDMEGLYEKHVLHSLSIAAAFEFEPGMEVLDLGTGGGFPGIPLAIFFPETQFLLADSIGKKLKVVEAIALAVNINNIRIRHTRVEDIKDKKFDTVVSRAVAPLGDLWRWSKPLLKKKKAVAAEESSNTIIPNGLICLKGGDLAKEIAESGCKPRMMELENLFEESFFKEKYLLHVPV